MKKVLILGSGGREHALGWKLGQSDDVSEVIYAPGNAGTAEEKGRNIALDGSKKENFPALFDVVHFEDVDMVVVGPEAPLGGGIVDFFNSRGYDRIFGPTQRASVLESDKFFSYDLLHQLGLPQADSVKCHSLEEAVRAIKSRTTPKGIVIKARGLTGGKGVSVCDSKEQALKEIEHHAQAYGSHVLIAERLFGQEFSIFGIADGNQVSPLELSIQDHKSLLDQDKGPNTGGMGAYGPVPIAPLSVVQYVAEKIMTPVVRAMKDQGREYQGFLYAGMIMTEQGPKVLEFNIRFGDPECQPVMMMLQSGLYRPLSLALEGKLSQIDLAFNPGAACCVVLASPGYPGNYQKGAVISGVVEAASLSGVKVFHAGTKKYGDSLVTAGGRILGVTAHSPEGIAAAHSLAYEAVSKIHVAGGIHYRKDIAEKALRQLM